MADTYSIKAILSAKDAGFTTRMNNARSTLANLKSTVTSGIGFGVMMGAGQKAISVLSGGFSALKNTAIDSGMSFESAMSSVSAISGAAGENLAKLTDKAKQMGATTQYSATEAANAMEYMAMAGWKTEDMISGIDGIMNLAAASGADLARTSDIVTDSLTAFGRTAKDSGRFADVMAAASANANTNVEMMGETFKYAGAAAGAMGYTIEDMAVATGLMANSGIKGSEAGTALRSTITRLAKPTKESAEAMEALGISITDSKGDMKSFGTIMKDMRNGMRGMTKDQKAAYAAMLGGQEAMSGILAIANASEEDFNKLSDAINNSTDAAKNMAKVKLDNLKGDVTILKSGVEGLGITIFSQLSGGFRSATQSATEFIGTLNTKLAEGKGIETFVNKVSDMGERAKPYFYILKNSAVELKDAFSSAISAVSSELGKLTGSLNDTKNISTFWDVVSSGTDTLKSFAGFMEKHADVIAKVITMLPKLIIAYQGFKILKTAAPLLNFFAGGLTTVATVVGKGLAGKLFGVSKGQEQVGKSSSNSSTKILTSAKAFMMMGVGVLAVAAGFGIMAYSAVQLANSGGLAIGVMAGMVGAVAALGAGMTVMINSISPGPAKLKAIAVTMLAFGAAVLMVSAGFAIMAQSSIALANAGAPAITIMFGMVGAMAGLMVVAGLVGQQLTAGAVGLVAFGAAVLIAGAGMYLMASAAIALSEAGTPAIACMFGMVGAMAGLMVLAAALGPALTAGAVGMIAFGVALVLVATSALIGAAALAVVAAVLPTIASYGASGAIAIAQLGASMVVFGAGTAVAGAGCIVLAAGLITVGAGAVVAGAGFVVLTAGLIACSAGVVVLAASLKLVNSSMKSIASNAKSAQKSLTSMVGSVNIVNAGLDALGNKAKSAISKLISHFSKAESKAQSSGQAVGNNFNSGVQSGMSRAISTANTMSISVTSAMRSASSGAYSSGVYIGTGLANGMASQIGYVRSVAAQLASAAEAAIRAKARIHSPSKVTDKLGGYYGIGWVNGILDKVRMAKQAAEKLVNIPKLVPAVDMGLSGYSFNDQLNDEYSYGNSGVYTIYVPVELDGREMAKATATYTQEELEKIDTRNRRKKGNR